MQNILTMNILHIIFCFVNRILFSETLYVLKTLYTFSATIAYILKSQKSFTSDSYKDQECHLLPTISLVNWKDYISSADLRRNPFGILLLYPKRIKYSDMIDSDTDTALLMTVDECCWVLVVLRCCLSEIRGPGLVHCGCVRRLVRQTKTFPVANYLVPRENKWHNLRNTLTRERRGGRWAVFPPPVYEECAQYSHAELVTRCCCELFIICILHRLNYVLIAPCKQK